MLKLDWRWFLCFEVPIVVEIPVLMMTILRYQISCTLDIRILILWSDAIMLRLGTSSYSSTSSLQKEACFSMFTLGELRC
jgi:hypothetical protein